MSTDRRYRSDEERLVRSVRLRLTEDEATAVERLAASEERPVSNWLRGLVRAAIDSEPAAVPSIWRTLEQMPAFVQADIARLASKDRYMR